MGTRWMTTLRKLPTSRLNKKISAIQSVGLAPSSSAKCSNGCCIVCSRGQLVVSMRPIVKRRALRGVLLRSRKADQIAAPNLKMGRYMAITMPPTNTPRMAMIAGSSRLLIASTAASTSAS